MTLPDNDALVALIERMAEGDQEAVGALWDAVSPWVHAALLRTLRDEDAAEVLSRRVVLEMWRVAPLWDQHVGRPLLWSLALARSLAVQWLDDRRRTREDGPATTPPTRAEREAARDAASMVGQALAAMDPAQAELLEAAWCHHPIDEDGIRVADGAALDGPLRAFAATLAG